MSMCCRGCAPLVRPGPGGDAEAMSAMARHQSNRRGIIIGSRCSGLLDGLVAAALHRQQLHERSENVVALVCIGILMGRICGGGVANMSAVLIGGCSLFSVGILGFQSMPRTRSVRSRYARYLVPRTVGKADMECTPPGRRVHQRHRPTREWNVGSPPLAVRQRCATTLSRSTASH